MARRPTQGPTTGRTPGKADRNLAAMQQAMQVFARGDHARALEAIRRVMKSAPNDAQAHRLCAIILRADGDLDRALFHAQKAVSLAPRAAPVHTTLGTVFDSLGDTDRALASMQRAVELNPADAESLTTLALTLDALNRQGESIAMHERALAASPPGSPSEAHSGMNASLAMLSMGRARDAVDLMQRLARAHPSQPAVAQRLAYCLNYDDRATRAQINAAHRRWGGLVESQTRPVPRPDRTAGLAADQRLRVAFVSPDLRAHSVSNFLGPLFDHLDRERFEVCAYFTSRHADAVTESLRPRVDTWHDCPGITDTELAAKLAADRADVAIDLSGHFAGNRLGAFAMSPAPIQITWLGYPATTGLSRIGARVVDGLTDPDQPDSLPQPSRESERLVRLDPCFLCYESPADAPAPPAAAPSTTGEPFTFASFNDLKKISPTTLDMWSAVLTRAPGSRLLLKAEPLGVESVRALVIRGFTERGIDPDRLLLLGRSPSRAEHLTEYSRVDLALDTFPYHGTTTTCESLWMGVPVLTRVAATPDAPHAARVGLSLLTNTGLADLCTRDADAFVARAVDLATNPDALASIRLGLRERFADSPVCDAAAFAARFGDMLTSLCSEAAP